MSTNHVTIERNNNPGCLLQLIWFAFVGWWLGQIWMIAAWVLMVTIIGIPFGVAMLNMLPKVIALRDPTDRMVINVSQTGAVIERGVPQVNMIIRAIYFILIGWWLSALWMETAYLISLTVIGLPIGFWMFDQVPLLVSLKR